MRSWSDDAGGASIFGGGDLGFESSMQAGTKMTSLLPPCGGIERQR